MIRNSTLRIIVMTFAIMATGQIIKGQSAVKDIYKPHRYEVPCDNKTVFTVKFYEPHNHIEVILMKNGFIVDYVTRETVIAGDELSVTSHNDNGNEEYVLIIKENGTIIYNEVINK